MRLREYPGWFGIFTREQAPGALPNGTRIVKVQTEKGDAHPIGARATVLGSMAAPNVGLGYFVEWDAKPRCAVFVVDWKVRPGNVS
jgi:hypothetical protein